MAGNQAWLCAQRAMMLFNAQATHWVNWILYISVKATPHGREYPF